MIYKISKSLFAIFLTYATFLVIFSTKTAFSQTSELKRYLKLDSFRYYVFIKDTIEIRKHVSAVKKAAPAHFNDLYLLCEAYYLLKDLKKASAALAGAVYMGMDTSYIKYKGYSISNFSIEKRIIDSARREHLLFQKRNQVFLDSQYYFLANDLRLYGNGNERGVLVKYFSKYMDNNLHAHNQLQDLLTSL